MEKHLNYSMLDFKWIFPLPKYNFILFIHLKIIFVHPDFFLKKASTDLG